MPPPPPHSPDCLIPSLSVPNLLLQLLPKKTSMDAYNKGILLLSMMAMLSLTIAAESSQNERVCDNESRVKLSIVKGLRRQHVMKESRMHHFERDVDEAKGQVKKAEMELKNMQGKVNTTRSEIGEIMSEVNVTMTPELTELEELQICSEDDYLSDCCQIKKMNPSARSGIYAIKDPCSGDKPFSYAKLAVYCDMETDGGGWMVIQRRNASMGWVNFTRNIDDYEMGFGDLDGEFWIGLKNIYELTTRETVAMKMKLWEENGNSMNWNYGRFQIYNKDSRYALQYASAGSGDGSFDAFGQTINTETHFIAYDYYYATPGWSNCGFIRQSGWWYYRGSCASNSNPNGRHQPSGYCGIDNNGERLVWKIASSSYRIYTHSEMKIRPTSCTFN